MLTVTDVENAIIARLRSEIPYLRTCGSLAEFLASDIEQIEELAPLLPAAYVVYGGGRFDHKMSGIQDRRMTFLVVVVVRNLRDNEAVRHGRAGEKGIYDLLEDVRAALTDTDCGIEIDPLLPEAEEPIAGTTDLAVYGISFGTKCRATL